MPDRDETEEPLQSLPPGMARRYAEYKPAPDKPSSAPANVGGYDGLLDYCQGKERDLTGLARAIGMFYGDVLTHIIPGAHWEVVEDGFPMVRISRNTSVSVIHVAQRRVDVGLPTLAMNYDHAIDLIDEDRLRGS